MNKYLVKIAEEKKDKKKLAGKNMLGYAAAPVAGAAALAGFTHHLKKKEAQK